MEETPTYIVVSRQQASSSEKARRYVKDFLEKNHFTSKAGRWNPNPIDSFVIGGGWSGSLTVAHLDETKLQKFSRQYAKAGHSIYDPKADATKKANKIATLFQKHFPDLDTSQFPCPFNRDPWEELGYFDDAMIVDEVLWEKIIKPRLGKSLFHSDGGGGVIKLESDRPYESDLCEEEIVGRFWCVVITFYC